MAADNAEAIALHNFAIDGVAYGGTHLAALALTMEMSGQSVTQPDPLKVHAFSRHDSGSGDIPSVLGAANSFFESGFDVRFRGMPAQALELAQPGQAKLWSERLLDHDPHAYDETPPTADTVRELLDDLRGKWTILLHLSGKALGEPHVTMQPTVVLGRVDKFLTVYNPGSPELPRSTQQRVQLDQALGALGTRHQSLLAVRRRRVEVAGTKITPSVRPRAL